MLEFYNVEHGLLGVVERKERKVKYSSLPTLPTQQYNLRLTHVHSNIM